MKVNYKFKFQIKFSKLSFNLDDSVDIEVSNFEKLQYIQDISDDIATLRDIYFTFYGYHESTLLASDLDKQDLEFLNFLEDVSSVNFDNVKFNGDFILVVFCQRPGYEFLLYVNEG